MAFHGPTLPADRQRELFRRWSTDPDVHPHEALVGLAALLHGTTTQELKHLTDDDIDHESRRIRSGGAHNRHRWTRGPGPHCNAALTIVRNWAATTPTC